MVEQPALLAGLAERAGPRRDIASVHVGLHRVPTARVHSQHLSKLHSECLVAQRVEERVHGGVEVADPRDGRHQVRIDALDAERHDEEADEVGKEAEREGAHDDAQLLGGLDLTRQRRALRVFVPLRPQSPHDGPPPDRRPTLAAGRRRRRRGRVGGPRLL